MRNALCTLFLSLSLSATAAAGTLINLEEAAEVMALSLQLNGKSSARVYARICDDCELLALQADASTRIERGRSLLSLEQAAQLKDRGATVLFDPATLRITRILYWN
ncbi:MAG: hypothetical protein KJO54_03040 [Gammaproteobacteria bacterium]|nr:hypothetical protein [Gammaproteobacteria bacterium]NNF61682.1 hypothetical protein [Gammaproteobacteria bacterium]NNM20312.1 hypothetical protein [Gammaproteobacteria bacterium]